MNNKIKTVGIVSPSFFIEKEDQYEKGISYLKALGLKLKFGACSGKKYFNTTGTPQERAYEINQMFADNQVDVIFASDGGCRAIEVLEYLDYKLIQSHPKPFCGFSDITHILLALYAKTNNVSIHGMDVLNGFGLNGSFSFKANEELFWDTLNNVNCYIDLQGAKVLKKGEGEGIAIGGWINAIQQLVNTEYFPRLPKMVLFWEAVDEEPNRINMMLHSLRLSGLFSNLSGMVIGELYNCDEKEYYDCIPRIEDIILDACVGYDFPILINAPFGHGENKRVFKYGTVIKISEN